MDPGRLRARVELADTVPDGTAVVFDPAFVWASIEPAAPSTLDDVAITHVVTVRYHPQISLNTRLRHEGRILHVRGRQNVEDRGAWLVLLCEEVITP